MEASACHHGLAEWWSTMPSLALDECPCQKIPVACSWPRLWYTCHCRPVTLHRLCSLKILISSNFHFCFWILEESVQASSPLSTGSQPWTFLISLPDQFLSERLQATCQAVGNARVVSAVQLQAGVFFLKSLNTPHLHLTIYTVC